VSNVKKLIEEFKKRKADDIPGAMLLTKAECCTVVLSLETAIAVMKGCADMDYRGNRSNESVACYAGLKTIEKICGSWNE
jgi:hypothetical protein